MRNQRAGVVQMRASAVFAALATGTWLAAAASAVVPLELVRSWEQIAQNNNVEDIMVGDFDGDGVPETVLLNYDTWVVLSPAGDGYQVEAVGPYEEYSTVGRHAAEITSADLAGDCRPELVVANNVSGEIEVWDLAKSSPLWTFPIAGDEILDVVAGDLDGDAQNELGVLVDHGSGDVRLEIYSGANGAFERSVATSGWELALAELDGDAAREIVVTQYGSGAAYDGATLAVDWSSASDVGPSCAIGDFDGDTFDEIATVWGPFTVFDPGDAVDGILWQLGPYWRDEERIGAADLDGDGISELLVDGGSAIDVRAGTDGSVLGSFTASSGPVEAIAVADSDGDGELEILWRQRMVWGCDEAWVGVQSAPGLAPEWRQPAGDVIGLVAGVSLDGSKPPTSVVPLSCGSNGPSFAHVLSFDGQTQRQAGETPLPASQDYSEVVDADVGQCDGDPGEELIGVFNLGTPPGMELACIDPVSELALWHVPVAFTQSMRALDTNGNGQSEILLHQSTSDPLHAYSGVSGAWLWDSEPVGCGRNRAIAAANVDADPGIEVVTLCDGGLAILIGADGTLERMIATSGDDLALVDADGDGDLDVVTISGENYWVSDPKTGTVSGPVTLFSSYLNQDLRAIAPAAGLRSASARDVVVLTHDGHLHLIDLITQSVVWTSPLVPADFTANVRLQVTDVDGDGDLDITYMAKGRIFVFALPQGLLFADDFETGNLAAWGGVTEPGTGCS